MDVNAGRWTAKIEGDFVVFLLGAQFPTVDPTGEITGLLASMIEMLVELEQDPEIGLLGYQVFGAAADVIVQYWRSFDALESYAKNPSAKHAPIWKAWNKLADDELSGAGVWHETFKVAVGQYEAIYANMPLMGLAKAGTAMTVTEAKASARQRIGA